MHVTNTLERSASMAGDNGTTNDHGFTQEDIDRLTGATTTLAWDDLDPEDQLDYCLRNPNMQEWMDDKAVEIFVSFRTIPKHWLRICAGYRALGGDVRL